MWRAARELVIKVEQTKRKLKEVKVKIPRQLQNSIKSAKSRLYQPHIHHKERLLKWWALRRLHLDLINLLKDTQEEIQEEEERKDNNDALGGHN